MKIGIDASILSRKRITGINRYLRNILKYIPEIDKRNEYFLFAPSDIESSFGNALNVKLIKKFEIFSSKFSLPFWINLALPWMIDKYKIDLFFQPNHFIPFYTRNENVKYVTVVHDLIPRIFPQYRDFPSRLYFNLELPFSIKRSKKIVTDSKSSKEDIINFYNISAEKINVIHGAADERFRPRALEGEIKNNLLLKYKLPKDFILHVGAIENRKNIIGILRIADLLKTKHEDIKIVLIGKPGFGSAKIFKEIKKRNNVIYLGHVEDEDLSYIHNLAKIFLFPSFYEGFGLPPLEAMQSGIPVLSSNCSSLPEVVGDGGIMHNPDDYESFFQDIVKLLEKKEFYQEMKNKAILQAKRFTWKNSAQELINIFNKI